VKTGWQTLLSVSAGLPAGLKYYWILLNRPVICDGINKAKMPSEA
jgi:hypothetical protein